ncbi:formate dehydrogenase subunit gamma [Bordetella genomosp. 9]|uniref:Formate dehydrogenase subunit gamma n=1 Tax=Bordetella genomosp. 9 TaxID=1416803 RepID=A0A1W6Z3J2_9BORD|nr:formate dehydrogenase subunit gamma [Bordetella genomosp. 9]ARP87846.1 formate dehydrogenase subunit gamma [Bordetella genomosp. 9]ARP91803.1 formate dehydrogenase subunit gamma [Bordetella genomosp. 9]
MREGQARADLASNAGARGGELAHEIAAQSDHPAIAAAARAVAAHKNMPGALLPILHAVQRELGCIPPEAVAPIAEALNLSRAEVHGVITFYPLFRQTPPGRHVVEVCRAESCQAMGGERIADHARQKLGCDFHATSSDGAFTLEPVYCLGLCAQSPAMLVDGVPYARLTPQRFDTILGYVKEAS